MLTSAPDDFFFLPSNDNSNDIVTNSYHLGSVGVPNALLQMAFNKLSILFLMLMATEMDHIRYNWNLKYHMIIFGNGTGKYTLDESSFPDELSLNKYKFWKAYRNWLYIIDIVADMHVTDSWKAHHSKMITDTSFTTWFQAWHEHNRLLRVQFVLTLFIVLPNSMEYCMQFEQCQNNQHTEKLQL